MPTPVAQSNVEKYLSVIAGHSTEVPSEPTSRVEWYLNEIVKNGGIGGKLVPQIVNALPATGAVGTLYLVPSQSGSGKNVYDEYIWIEDETKFELLGQTTVEIDLSGYVPNSRKVGGKPLSADVGISVTVSSPLSVVDNSDASNVVFAVSHGDSGVTASSKGDTTNQTPGFGGTFKVLSATVDAKGHVTALGDHTVEIPDAEATVSAKGLMSAANKAKLDKHVPKGSATHGIYIDASDNTQTMTYELNADVPANFAPATAAPLMDGTAAVGTSVKYAREDHVHPLIDFTTLAAASPVGEQHRMVFGGRNLGSSVNAAQIAAVRDGSFSGLLVGDYWTINNVNWRIADMDYWYNCGDTAFDRHHLVIMPDSNLTTAEMNETSTTAGGYVGCKMYTDTLPTIKTTCAAAFPSMILTHRDFLVSAVTNGKPSAGIWRDSDVELPSEIMVYGCRILSPANDGTTVATLNTISRQQLALFNLVPRFIKSSAWFWLRDPVSATDFAGVYGHGAAGYYGASSGGVRPVFPIG